MRYKFQPGEPVRVPHSAPERRGPVWAVIVAVNGVFYFVNRRAPAFPQAFVAAQEGADPRGGGETKFNPRDIVRDRFHPGIGGEIEYVVVKRNGANYKLHDWAELIQERYLEAVAGAEAGVLRARASFDRFYGKERHERKNR